MKAIIFKIKQKIEKKTGTYILLYLRLFAAVMECVVIKYSTGNPLPPRNWRRRVGENGETSLPHNIIK